MLFRYSQIDGINELATFPLADASMHLLAFPALERLLLTAIGASARWVPQGSAHRKTASG